MNNISFADVFNNFGYSMFDNIVIPPNVEKEILINSIIDKVMLYQPLFTDYNFLTIKTNLFFSKNAEVFARLSDAFKMEYNPLHNYDSTEQIVDKATNTRTGQNVDTSKVSAFDVDTFSNSDQMQSDINEQDVNEYNHELRRFGNIGVTTSQQMIESELNVRPKLNIYDVIANLYFNEFCIATI